MEELHLLGGEAVIKGGLEWSIQEYIIYYPVVLFLVYGVILLDSLNYSFQARHGFRRWSIMIN